MDIETTTTRKPRTTDPVTAATVRVRRAQKTLNVLTARLSRIEHLDADIADAEDVLAAAKADLAKLLGV